ncbi:peptidoglycan/LPS O-acetylase OafA/YrhL [Novosphingobium chloroacetimidivorans]|uniref:Peptidoglycan/LPS O-acetylase OafA/YrhL n=1 Tax=Novosphingobium chloroacetimidivorans TaxID=1428314 RepID=A0A7W7NWK2_9SPHN|nr:peptidoglycan/LPS O-acetylase OafA/YrhL [Novosphingobium chloroacetimidivorans]
MALSVLVVHAINIGNHDLSEWMWQSWFGPIERFILPSFFALSGYLVTGSLGRNSIPQFIMLRVARIFPALIVEVLLSAFVLGALVTTLPIKQYVTSPEFHAYLLNMFGIIHYTLPGVFEGKALNVQLWTIPFELECYIAIVVFGLLGLVTRPRMFLSILSALIVIMTIGAVWQDWYETSWNVPGRMLVIAFLCGCLAYLFRHSLRHSPGLFAGSVILSYVFLYVPNLVFLAAMPLTYATVYIGLLRLPKIPFGDISYGVYLFHFPIARTIHELSGETMGWPLLLVLTLGLSGLFATGSWRLVEKPVLGQKRALLAATDRACQWFVRPWQARKALP